LRKKSIEPFGRYCVPYLRPQLDSLFKGLLEMVPSARVSDDIFFGYKVQFFHRTVREYLRDDLRQRQFQGRLPDFNLGGVYSRLCLAELKFARTKQSYFADHDNMLYRIFHDSHLWHLSLYRKGRKARSTLAKSLAQS
jgi:hypothetical protein